MHHRDGNAVLGRVLNLRKRQDRDVGQIGKNIKDDDERAAPE
jgi:hypothetical protein